MNNKRIISFYYKHKSGGFTTRLYKAWRGLIKSGYQVTYISTEKLPVEDDNITAHIVTCRSKPGTALFWGEYFIRAIISARKIIKKDQVNCFFVFSFFYGALAAFSGFGKGVKTLVFIRADDLHTSSLKTSAKLRIKVHLLLEKLSMKYASLVVATNKNMMVSLKSRTVDKVSITYLPNNIVNADTQYLQPKFSSADNNFRFVTTAVLNEGKNILYTLHALNKMHSTNWEFLIVGDDVENTGYGEQLKQYISDHDLHDRVKLLGWMDDADTLVSRCDLFITSTIMEGSPNALLEALGTNISCVGSDIPEISEILAYPELVFDLNTPASLAESLESFCREADFREKFSDLSLKCREKYVFDWEERVVSFVEDVTAND